MAGAQHVTVVPVHQHDVAGVEGGLHGGGMRSDLHGYQVAAEADGRVVAVRQEPALHLVLRDVPQPGAHLAHHRGGDVVLRLRRFDARTDRSDLGIHEAHVLVGLWIWALGSNSENRHDWGDFIKSRNLLPIDPAAQVCCGYTCSA